MAEFATPVAWQGRLCKVVLQLLQQPLSYRSQAESVGWSQRHGDELIDAHFANAEVHRCSGSKGSVFLYGLMVRVEPEVIVHWPSRGFSLGIAEHKLHSCSWDGREGRNGARVGDEVHLHEPLLVDFHTLEFFLMPSDIGTVVAADDF